MIRARKAFLLFLSAFVCYITGPLAVSAQEDGPPPRPYGSIFRALTGGALEKHEITVVGWAEASAVANFQSDINDDNGNLGPQGFLNTKEGFNFNAVGLMMCKGIGCIPAQVYRPKQNLISRIGPIPAPKSEEIQVGFNVTGMFGRDVQFLKTKGFDDNARDAKRDHKFGLTQWYLDFYFPIADGMTLMLGSFQTSLENDIGYAFTPPNWFATHTHAFAHGPAKHTGALAQIKVPTSKEFGLLSLEAGVVMGWNNLDHDPTVFATPGGPVTFSENDDPHYILGLRYRTPDMKTWIDIETMFGNGANDLANFTGPFGLPTSGNKGGGSPYLALSTTGEDLDRFVGYLVVSHQFTDNLKLALEATYGYQEGGDAGFITEDSEWYGVNVAARYKIRNNLHFNTRAEWFADEDGANILWILDPDLNAPIDAAGSNRAKGDVYSFTTNLSWDPTPNLNLRPELRYDYFDGTGKMFSEGRDDQFLGTLNAVLKF